MRRIVDCDSVLVLNAGELVEHGPPGVLANASGGVFAAMVAASRHHGK